MFNLFDSLIETQNILTALAGGNSRADGSMIANETRKKFDLWYFQQVLNRYRQVVTLAAQAQQNVNVNGGSGGGDVLSNADPMSPGESNARNYTLPFDMVESFAKVAAAAQLTDSIIAKARSPDQMMHSSQKLPLLLTNQLLASSQSNTSHSSPALQQHLQQQQQPVVQPQQHQQQQHQSQSKQQTHNNATGFTRTRIRTSFDPELELPKLQKWFAENHHPSRTQVQHYVDELNSLESRRGRKPLDSNNVVYWFKNARAAHKRQELKGVNGWSRGGSSSPPALKSHESTTPSFQNRTPDGLLCRTMSDVMIGKMALDHHNDPDEDDEDEGEDSSSDDRMDGSDDDEEEDNESTSDAQLNGHHNNKSCSPNTSLPCNTMSPSNHSNNSSGNANHHHHNNNNHIIISNLNSPDNSPEVCNRVRRSRTFIDPMSEVPRLEQWFAVNTHPTHSQIVKYTDELNQLQYRQKFPKLEPKNIQFWFKNRRAKYKRLSIPPLDLSLTPTSHINHNGISLTGGGSSSGVTTHPVNGSNSNNNGPKSSSSLSPSLIVSGVTPDSTIPISSSHTSDRPSPPSVAAFPVF
jgi:hypothetical protein